SIDSESNTGTVSCRSRSPAPSWMVGIGPSSAEGTGWGGGPVVVRARERRAHGEGGQQVGSGGDWNAGSASVNTHDSELALYRAERRVLEIQTKLHRWANDDPHRRFDDLFNLVTDPDVLLMAWERVAGNRGARSAGVDGKTAALVEERIGVERVLAR